MFDPLNPDPDLINIEDIAHALSMQCRFSGHTTFHYSVGSHSLVVCRLCPAEHQLWGLLHDASEAYLVDLPSPVKKCSEFKVFRRYEQRLHEAIHYRFKVQSQIDEPAVKHADAVALAAEKRQTMGLTSSLEGLDWREVEAAESLIHMNPTWYVERAFLEMFRRLSAKNEAQP
jgi:5'-deoxynucleotidase YfbR-like HD superfamily hydrolase